MDLPFPIERGHSDLFGDPDAYLDVPDGDDKDFSVLDCATPEECMRVLESKIKTWMMGKNGRFILRHPAEMQLCPDDGPCPGKFRAYMRILFVRV